MRIVLVEHMISLRSAYTGVCMYRKTCVWTVGLACAPGSQGSAAEFEPWCRGCCKGSRALCPGLWPRGRGALRGAAECRLRPGPWRGPWKEAGVRTGWADTRLLDLYLFSCWMKETNYRYHRRVFTSLQNFSEFHVRIFALCLFL